MKYLALVWLCVCLTPVFAQIPEELPELEIPAQAEEAWASLFSELREQPLALAARSDLFSKNPQIHLNSCWQLPRAELLALYNRDLNKNLDAFSFRLGIGSANWDAVLGNYRLRFGRGLVSGSSSRAQPDSLFSFLDPLSPRNYGLQGAAAAYRHKALRATVFASMQNREAKLDAQGNIRSIQKSRGEEFSTANESILAAAAGISIPRLQAGILCQRLEYDREFVSSELDKTHWTTSVYGSFKIKKIHLDAESVLLDENPAALLNFSYKTGGFEQSISYARNGLQNRLPFALTPALLSKNTDSNEWNFDWAIPLPLKSRLKLRYAINNDAGGSPLSRFIGSLSHSHGGRQFGFLFQSYDSEIISRIDSSYVASEPRNHRFRLWGRYPLVGTLQQNFDFVYALQDRQNYSRNSHRAKLGFAYTKKDWKLALEYLSWQNLHQSWQSDEFDPWLQSLCAAEDRVLNLDLAWKRGAWKLSAQGTVSFLDAKNRCLSLRCTWKPQS